MTWVKLEDGEERAPEVIGTKRGPKGPHEKKKPVRNAMPMLMSEVRAVNREVMEGQLCSMLTSQYSRIKEINEDDSEVTFKRLAASVIVKAVERGDQASFNFLLERTIGKVREEPSTAPRPYDQTLDAIPVENLLMIGSSIMAKERVTTTRDKKEDEVTL